VDAITAIDQTSMPVDENVAVAARRRRQLAIIISRNRMDSAPHVAIEHVSLAKPGFIFRAESVSILEPRGRMVVVMVVPVARDLPIMVIEPRMVLRALIVALSPMLILVMVVLIVTVLILAILILSTVLRADCTASYTKNEQHAARHP